MQDSLALSLLSQIAIAWIAVSVLVALAFGVTVARLGNRRRLNERRRGLPDRRSGLADRRIGLPDPRAHPVERRSGTRERRAGPGDRRHLSRRGPTMALGS